MTGRQSKILAKLLNVSKKKKNNNGWFDGNVLSKSTNLASTHRQNSNASRRVVVLNNLFMKNVTDLMASSQLGENIAGLGIEISRVQVCQHFHGLNVFWFSSANDSELLSIEKRLNEIAGPLRHELSQLRLMGEVPRITFVKDRKYSLLNEVDALLNVADFGEDHERNPYGQRIKKEFDTTYAILETNDSTSDITPIRNDLFGVDRNAIMRRIDASIAKTKNAWQAFDQGIINQQTGDPSAEHTFDSLRQLTVKEKYSEGALQSFLSKRKMDRKMEQEKIRDAKKLLEEEEEETSYRDEWENEGDNDGDDNIDPLGVTDIKYDHSERFDDK